MIMLSASMKSLKKKGDKIEGVCVVRHDYVICIKDSR